MTNQEAINQALQMIGVLESGSDASATDSADSLSLLNQMMAQWAVSGRDIQFPPQDTLSDTFPVPAWAEEAVISNLAIKAAALFNAVLSQQLIAMAMNGSTTVLRVLTSAKIQPVDMSHLPSGSGRAFNINDGTTT